MERRTHSKINKLDPNIKEKVDTMIKSGVYYRDIVKYIKSCGVNISITAVGKYAKNLMSTLDTLRMNQKNFHADQFQTLIFEVMADEEPELYKQVKKFIKQKQEQ